MKKGVIAAICGVPMIVVGFIKARKYRKQNEALMKEILENQERLATACEKSNGDIKNITVILEELKSGIDFDLMGIDEKEIAVKEEEVD